MDRSAKGTRAEWNPPEAGCRLRLGCSSCDAPRWAGIGGGAPEFIIGIPVRTIQNAGYDPMFKGSQRIGVDCANQLLTATVKKDDVHTYLDGRDEQEILVESTVVQSTIANQLETGGQTITSFLSGSM
jgi:hypothetical protein